MKSILTSRRLLRQLTLLLCGGLLAIALPAHAKDKHHRSHTHHYNSHYRGHSSGHSRSRNFDRYDPRVGYYNGYYRDYPVYAPNYRGRSSYGHSNYGRSRHNSLAETLLRQLLSR